MKPARDIPNADSLSWISRLLLFRARPIGHFAFWLAVLLFYTLYFGARQDSYGQSFVFVGLLMPITIATTYFVLYWLIPQYLLTQRYFYFILYLIYTLVFSLYLELLSVLLLYINVSGYQAMFVKPGIVDLLDVLVGMYLVVFLATSIHLLKRWFSAQAANATLETAKMETELKLKEAELQILKSQIHPHFLFNTLNNLYALSLEGSDQVPDTIMQISEQLDYVLNSGKKEKVTIADEVSHIENFLNLEALRYEDNQLDVKMQVSGNLEKNYIAPLLLIPFVENSFKHGISQSRSPSWIKFELTVQDHQMRCVVKNSKEAGHTQNGFSRGIGLENVQRRLALLYPDMHTLNIKESEDAFEVQLNVKLNGNA